MLWFPSAQRCGEAATKERFTKNASHGFRPLKDAERLPLGGYWRDRLAGSFRPLKDAERLPPGGRLHRGCSQVSVRSKMRRGCHHWACWPSAAAGCFRPLKDAERLPPRLEHPSIRHQVSVRSKMRRGCHPSGTPSPPQPVFPSAQRCGEAATPILGSSCSC